MGECEEDGGDAKADAYDERALKKSLDGILEKESDDADGDHRDEDVHGVACLVVPFELEEPAENPFDFLPEDDECGEYGGHMYGDVELQSSGEGLSAVEQYLPDLEVSARRHWQVFRKSLYKAQDKSF